MGTIGTFGTFTQARLGIYAAQKGLSVVGNNISNINTEGYTRQNLDQVSLKTGGDDRYQSKYDVKVGNGVLCTSVSQIRDPYLDIRYRTESASVGYMDHMLSGLKDVSAILDEVGDGTEGFGILEAEMNDFFDALERLDYSAGEQDYDILARASANTLCTLFNSYANKLETVRENTQDSFTQDINRVNEILNNIRDLNSRIRKSDIHGDNALEMRDDRNLLIDELSQYMKIDVVYTMEDVGAGQEVEKLTIRLDNANPDPDAANQESDRTVLVDGVYARQIYYPKANPEHETDPAAPKYITKEGVPTNDMAEAEQEFDENYNLSLGKLMDAKGREWKDICYDRTEVAASGSDSVTESDSAGVHQREDVQYVTVAGQDGKNHYYKVTTTTKTSVEIDPLDDNDLYGSLQADRELLTEAGEFSTQETVDEVDESAATKRGIPYYQRALDLLANQFATELNKANQGCMVDQDGNYLSKDGHTMTIEGVILNEDTELTDLQKSTLIRDGYTSQDKNGAVVADLDKYLRANGMYTGGNLFSIRGDKDEAEDPATGEVITASNISVAKSWSEGSQHIVTTFIKPFGDLDNTTQGSNIDHMIVLMDKKLDYNPQNLVEDAVSTKMFNGSFQEMFNNMNTVLGNDISTTTIQLDTYNAAATELNTSRDDVASVDLNDEAMNMMQYSKAMTAAMRLMTTIDSVLERLINNTGLTG